MKMCKYNLSELLGAVPTCLATLSAGMQELVIFQL